MAGIFDRADDAYIQLPGHQEIVQLGGCAGNQLTAVRQLDDAAIYRPVNWGAIDVADAPDLHSCTSIRSEEHTLNSSHQIISYAVFCLKKKNNNSYFTAIINQ